MTTTPISETIPTRLTADLAWIKTHVILFALLVVLV